MKALFVNENVELVKDLTYNWSVVKERQQRTILPAGYRGVVVEDEHMVIVPLSPDKVVRQLFYRVHFITPEGRHLWAYLSRNELRSVEAVPA